MARGLSVSIVLGLASANVPAKLKPLSEAMQAMLDGAATSYNTSFQVAFRSSDGFFELASGDMAVDSLVPLGSATKPWTCAALLRAAEQGAFSMDDPAHTYIDPVLRSENGTTLWELWKGNSAINTVTTRQLCHHSSGIADYDGGQNELLQLLHPDQDETPTDYLYLVDKELSCTPGTCSCYSGIGFILAGYVLAGLQNASTWTEMDQLAFLPDDLRARWEPNAVFGKEGRCADYERVVHQWLPGTDPKDNSTAIFWDLRNHSCLNGWTMGNLASTAGVLADFHWELFNGGILNERSLEEMRTYDVFSEGCWAAGVMSYGLGLEKPKGSVWDIPDYQYEGHGGQDYGSKSDICGYNAQHDFSYCITVNSMTGMNCSSSKSLAQSLKFDSLSFYPYQAAVQWQQNHSTAGALKLLDSATPVPVLPSRSTWALPVTQLTHRPLGSSVGGCSQGGEDYTLEWELSSGSSGCRYSEAARVFYKATLVRDAALRLRQYSSKNCLGQASVDVTTPLDECLTFAGNIFSNAVKIVFDPQSPNKVVEKVWNAGGITKCEWRPMFDSVVAAAATDTTILV